MRAFFKKPRRVKDHLRWLKAQGFKEYSAIKPIIAALAALYPNIDRGIDRHDYTELTEKLADETKHARLVMDLLEEISGKKITPRDLTWLPQDRKLAKVRAKYSKSYAGLLHGSEKITGREMKRRKTKNSSAPRSRSPKAAAARCIRSAASFEKRHRRKNRPSVSRNFARRSRTQRQRPARARGIGQN